MKHGNCASRRTQNSASHPSRFASSWSPPYKTRMDAQGFPVGRYSRQASVTAAQGLNEWQAEATAQQPVLQAQKFPVLVGDSVLPPARLASGVDIAVHDAHAQQDSYGVRVTQSSSASGEITRGFLVDGGQVNPANLQPGFPKPCKLSDNANACRLAIAEIYNAIARPRACVFKQGETLALLRNLLVKPTWSEGDFATLASLKRRIQVAFGRTPVRGKLFELMAEQRSLVEELQKLHDATPNAVPSLFDIATDVLTAAASTEGPSERVNELIRARLNAGIYMFYDEPAPTLNEVKVFVYTAGFRSRELGPALPGFVSLLLEALTTTENQEWHAFALEYVKDVATQLGFPGDSADAPRRPRHAGRVAYAALARTFVQVARDPVFRNCLLNFPDSKGRVLQWASPFATLLLCNGDQGVWPAVFDVCVNTPKVPELFEEFIKSEQLWERKAAAAAPGPSQARCNMSDHRLGFLFKLILALRLASERPVLPGECMRNVDLERKQAQRCFAALVDILSRLNAIDLLEIAIRPENPGGPVDSVLLRRFQADAGMRFPWLASDAVPLRVLFSNGLWASYETVFKLLNPSSGGGAAGGGVAAAPVISSDPAAAPAPSFAPVPASALAGAVPLAADIMTVFRNSIANPVLDKTRLYAALSELVDLVNKVSVLSTAILGQLGELLPAGYASPGRLTAVEEWLEASIVPGLANAIERIIDLYPTDGTTTRAMILELIEGRVAAEPSLGSAAIRNAVSAFTADMLMFDAPGPAGANKKQSLGPVVADRIDAVLKGISQVLRKADAAALREPAASDLLVRNLASLSSAWQTMAFFRRETMVEIVRSKLASLYRAVLVLHATANVQWTPTDIRSTSNALAGWSTADLLRLDFLEQTGGAAGPVDIDAAAVHDAVVDSESEGSEFIADAVAAAFPDDDENAQKQRAASVKAALLAHVQYHVAQALTLDCLASIDAVVQSAASGGVNLQEAATQFQAIADRKLTQRIFSCKDFSDNFRAHAANARALAGLEVSSAEIDRALSADVLELLNSTTISHYEVQFNSMSVPVTFLLPSQLIAISIATALAPRSDLLMRLGTGMGKSIVLALTALMSLRADRTTRVFVLTTFDHLAERDHKFAKPLFGAEGIQSIAITHDPASLAGFNTAHVIYANALAVDKLLSDFKMELLEGRELSADQAAFVRAFYNMSTGSPYTVLLDEFDLIIEDLRDQKPNVRPIPTSILKRADAELPSQDIIPELQADEHDALRWINASEAEDVMNPATGIMRKRVYPMMFVEGDEPNGWFNLAPSAFRLSEFLTGARRVVGLSGSTDDDAKYKLGRRNGGAVVPYFALNCTHDPTLFDTRIVPADFSAEGVIEKGSEADLRGASGIWCHTRLVINRPSDHVVPNDPATGLPYTGDIIRDTYALPTTAEVEEWAQKIVGDIMTVTSAPGPKRPVLLFAPSADKVYKAGPEPAPGVKPPTKLIRDYLITKIKASFSADVVFVPPTECDLSDADMQRIGQAGIVTIAGAKLGRGVDIRPSPEIPGGLHVIVGVEVAHKRLLKQMIGRTGRFGRPGSFSIIALHRILSAPCASYSNDQWWMSALHNLTALGIAHLTAKRASLAGADRKTWVQRWLLFLLGCTQRGKDETDRVKAALAAAPDAEASLEWCIPAADFEKLIALVPRCEATEPFYARLEALRVAGPRSVDADAAEEAGGEDDDE